MLSRLKRCIPEITKILVESINLFEREINAPILETSVSESGNEIIIKINQSRINKDDIFINNNENQCIITIKNNRIPK